MCRTVALYHIRNTIAGKTVTLAILAIVAVLVTRNTQIVVLAAAGCSRRRPFATHNAIGCLALHVACFFESHHFIHSNGHG